MCRGWTGAAFATLIWFQQRDLQWEGTRSVYKSSPIARREHCATCGTPLALIYEARDDIAVTAGTLSDPSSLQPTSHYGCEARLAWTAGLGPGLPSRPTRESW
ncbi:MAG: family glutathione-dependent formaldehyde-activating protein [Reyranella sp.]|nr:family glutathione-dependent formaldehyde-activating protein [Reyranella sp.]